MFMSACTLFVFLSLIEYAFVNVMMGDIRSVFWEISGQVPYFGRYMVS